MGNEPKRILVVDDEDDIRQLLTAILEDAGYVVDTASGGYDALRKIVAARPDLVTLDMGMPDLDGRSVLDRLAQSSDPPRVLVITGAESVDLVPLRSFVGGFLSKPFRVDVLLGTCRSILSAPAEQEPEAGYQERRRTHRRRVVADATILSREGTPAALGRLIDLSPAGAQLDLGAPLDPGSTVSLALEVPGFGQPITVRGTVVWRQTSRLGIAFSGLTPDDERRLSDLLTDK